MERCANTEYLNAHMRTVDREEKRLDAIDQRKAQLLSGDCSPSNTGAVLEALYEIPQSFADQIAINIGHIGCIPNPQLTAVYHAVIGRLVCDFIEQYCEKEAQRIAENEINNASCQKCFDEGCRFCVE